MVRPGFIIVLFLLVSVNASAQFGTLFRPLNEDERYVSATIHMHPPYIPFLSEYADERSDQFFVRLILNDLSMRFDQIWVRITLESRDIVWKSETKIFSFEGQWMLELSGKDFVPFFASVNQPQNISQSGMLRYEPGTYGPYQIPSGFYRIGLEINGFGSQLQPTKVWTPDYYFSLDEPPKLQTPKNKNTVPNGQPLHFTWNPRHKGSEIIGNQQVEYHLELFRSSPDNSKVTLVPDWEVTTVQPEYTIMPDNLTLQPGQYFWRVHVTVDGSAYYFDNDGYSKTFTFHYL